MEPVSQDRWTGINPARLDEELRPSLRNVGLVGELNLSLDGDLYGKARSASRRLISHESWQIMADCSAATVIFMVAEGIHRYDGGTFWPNISVDGIDRNRVARAFFESLSSLGLETFQAVVDEERGLRNVTPILLHGGIPAYCAKDVWRQLLGAMRSETGDVTHMLSIWRTRGYPGLDKPVERFLRHGGAFAEDLLARMWQCAEDVADIGIEAARELGGQLLAHDAGLPNYLVEKLLEERSIDIRRGPRLPRPRVRIDPYSSSGPELELPPAPGHDGCWILSDTQGRPRRFSISRHETRVIPLSRPTTWDVSFQAEDTERMWTLAGMPEAPAFLFSDNCELAGNQASLRGTSVLVLCPATTRFLRDTDETPIPELEDLPPLTGNWSKWHVRSLDLTDLDALVVVWPAQPELGQEEIRQRVSVASSVARPHICSEPLRGVLASGGRPVFSQPPLLHVVLGRTAPGAWRVRFRPLNGQPKAVPLSDLTQHSDGFDTAPLFSDQVVSTGTLEVVGPLGSDLREELAVVPGLHFGSPDRVVDPFEHVEVEVAASVALDSREQLRAILTFPPGCDSQELLANPTGGGVDLHHSIPRLLWMVRRSDSTHGSFGHEAVRISLDELEMGKIEAIDVRVRREEPLVLELWASDETIQTAKANAKGPEGRWSFPLAEFLDTARHANVNRLYFKLRAGSVVANAAVIETAFEVSNLRCESEVDSSEDTTFCALNWTENRNFSNREIRMWSQHRLWAPPICIPIDDYAAGQFDFLCQSKLPAGPYLLELTIRDTWGPLPIRPTLDAPHVIEVDIGDDINHAQHLNQLNRAEPLNVLELAVAGQIQSLNNLETEEIYSELNMTLDVLYSSGNNTASIRTLRGPLLALEFSNPSRLAEHLSESWGEYDSGSNEHLFALLPGILNQPPGDEDRLHGIHNRLWRTNPLAAAAFDRLVSGDIETAQRWEQHTGWNPFGNTDSNELFPGGPIPQPLGDRSPEHLTELEQAIPISGSGRLLYHGFLSAIFDFLAGTWHNRDLITEWRSPLGLVLNNDHWMTEGQRGILACLQPDSSSPAWYRFPQDLQAVSFHLLDFPASHELAARTLAEAMEFAPQLTLRCLILAIALHHSANF